ncbi:glycosyltransferase family 2 protein [Bacillus dakarensis]|uniref:glycosyltransferase family 2 protein n=1 Tax=Robertmurraya dakarensis TaxID=1926278 RepID=UPI000980B619|nr:glycosyltransferase family 2 protein [Bacillus dakarensis]
MLPKVSVVVPIYKVEKYLHRCVESIVNQTYPILEIILVDDGSPDGCGKIADAYAENDKRILSVHKENGGLSDARNYGMQYATGEFTIFVDSDDWLEHNMIETLVETSIKYGADVVQTAFYYAHDHELFYDNRYYQRQDLPVVLNNQTLMKELVINERVKNFAWGKLYKTNLIKDIPFKKGVLFEDVFWAHQVMQRVHTFVLLNQPLCYYYQRSDSIVANYTPRNLDIIKGLKERHNFIERYYQDLKDESLKMILKTSLIHYNLLLVNRRKDAGGKYRDELQTYIKENYSTLKNAVNDDKQLKIQLCLFKIHPTLYISYLIYLKILRALGLVPKPLMLEKVVIKQ